jgi:serine protease AprX
MKWGSLRRSVGMASMVVLLLAAESSAAPVRNRGVRLEAAAARRAAETGLLPGQTLDYGTFRWAVLSDAEVERLSAAGVPYETEPDTFTLRLGEQSFDPLVSTPAPPAGWGALRGSGPDLQLVQFIGPTRRAWVERLEQDGLTVVQYIPPFTYVVWGDGAARDRQAQADTVRWTGPFLPAYRVLPRWQALDARLQDVKVMMVRSAGTAAMVQALEALGGQLEAQDASDPVFDVARFALPGNAFAAAAQIPGVYSLQVVPTDGGLRGEMSDQVNANNVNGSNQAFPGYVAWLASVGLSGAGVIIANVDGGVQNNHPDLVNRLVACTGSTCGGSATSPHGTHTAGIMAADASSGTKDSYGFYRGLGVAPGAHLVEQVYSPTYTQPNGMLLLMTQSFTNGASLSGNSWGPSSKPLGYDDDTRQVDVGVRDAVPTTGGNQPLTLVLSIMNGYGGTSTQGTPDEAKNIFTIGATKMQTSAGAQISQIDDLADVTAHGPALDGRKIPHLVAPGCWVDSTYSTSTWNYDCGTSMASPHVSGAVALFIEHYRGLPTYVSDPSPALIKAAFLPVARDLAGHLDADGGTLGHPFDSKQGWGRMDLAAVLTPQVAVRYYDNPLVLNNTGEEWTVDLTAPLPAQPLRLMLVWTDAPGHGLGGSTPAWNNNLDLIVESGGDTYRGNNFAASGWSATGGASDTKNNTEGVFIGPTAAGTYHVRVLAANLTSDAIPGVGDATDQDFALVCYNCAEVPSGPLPPVAEAGSAATPVYTPVAVTLHATDDGLPNPPAALDYVITQLPAHGTLADPATGAIGAVPATLAGHGDHVVYTPYPCYRGADSFQFLGNDGGTAPSGGASNVATVTLNVLTPPVQGELLYSFPMDTNPGWTVEGAWAFGHPTGGGSHNGDPNNGYTGTNVYGYSLTGDYPDYLTPTRYLTTTALSCTGRFGIELRFRRWLGVEHAPFDVASIDVSNDGTTWTSVWANGSETISDAAWSLQSYDLSAVADGQATVYVRWGMGPTDSGVHYPGWNIDDVEIWATTASASDLNGDGVVDLFDVKMFEACLAGPDTVPPPACACADRDGDSDVDLADFAELQNAF